jgi:hypothetical protein
MKLLIQLTLTVFWGSCPAITMKKNLFWIYIDALTCEDNGGGQVNVGIWLILQCIFRTHYTTAMTAWAQIASEGL